jgi:prepilin-type N-terminal cleavage/methylation domain-containing protein
MRTPTRRPRGDETGFTLVEYTVAMAIFAVLIAITMSGVVMMTDNTVKTTNLSTATDQIRQAFTKLDRQVRYADNVNRPVLANGKFYLEFQALNGDGVSTCYQWRLDPATKRVQWRQWPSSPQPATVNGTFTTVASNIANTTAQPPFTHKPANTTRPFQGVDVMFVGRRAAVTTSTVTLQTSLTARNSSVASQSNTDTNADGISDDPVCETSAGAVSRP